MELFPRDIHEKQFHDAWRGYSQEEVDDFLDRVAEVLGETQRENDALKDRVSELEATVDAARRGEEALRQTLVTAQRAAEESLQKARRQAQELAGEAEARARKVSEEAREQAARIETEARRKASELERSGERKQRELEGNLERLRTFETELKRKLKAFLDHQQRTLGGLSEHRSARPPQDSRSAPVTQAARPEQRRETGDAVGRRAAPESASARPAEPPDPRPERQATPVPGESTGEMEALRDSDLEDFSGRDEGFGPPRRGLRSLFGRDHE